MTFRDEGEREAFWALVDRSNPDGCWPWRGSATDRGYGWFGSWRRRAAREALQEALGRPLEPGEQALHACDNPPCVRVAEGHVFAGTQADNIHDMIAKGRRHRVASWAGKKMPTALRAKLSEVDRAAWARRLEDPAEAARISASARQGWETRRARSRNVAT